MLALVTATALAGSAAGQPYRPRPLPTESPLTDRDFGAALLDYNRRTLVAAYTDTGLPCDIPARAALDGLARQLSGAADAPGFPSISDAAGQGLGQGCTNSLVLYARACALAGQGLWQEARPVLADVYERLPADSSIPASRKMHVPERLAAHYFGSGATRQPVSDAWLKQSLAWAVASLGDGSFSASEDWLFFHTTTGLLASWQQWGYDPDELWGELARLLEKSGIERPWLLHMVRGMAQETAAWNGRGRWAGADASDSHTGFKSHMQMAYKEYKAAHDLAPDRPEAARRLIAVAKTGPIASDEPPRCWFDRAVAVMWDDVTAYQEMVDALRPRWGGSRQALLAFGDECIETGRYDSNIPAVMGEVIRILSEDLPAPGDIYRHLPIYRRAQRYLSGIIASPATIDASVWRARLLVAAYWAGDQDTARMQAQILGPSFTDLLPLTRPFDADPTRIAQTLGLPADYFEAQRASGEHD
jgi:hypothetical protein